MIVFPLFRTPGIGLACDREPRSERRSALFPAEHALCAQNHGAIAAAMQRWVKRVSI
jgi:hypothetical protein